MATLAECRIVVVWESELKAAAAALRRAKAALADKDTPPKELDRALYDALNACYAALYGIDGDGHIVCSSHDRLKYEPREIAVNPPAKVGGGRA